MLPGSLQPEDQQKNIFLKMIQIIEKEISPEIFFMIIIRGFKIKILFINLHRKSPR